MRGGGGSSLCAENPEPLPEGRAELRACLQAHQRRGGGARKRRSAARAVTALLARGRAAEARAHHVEERRADHAIACKGRVSFAGASTVLAMAPAHD